MLPPPPLASHRFNNWGRPKIVCLSICLFVCLSQTWPFCLTPDLNKTNAHIGYKLSSSQALQDDIDMDHLVTFTLTVWPQDDPSMHMVFNKQFWFLLIKWLKASKQTQQHFCIIDTQVQFRYKSGYASKCCNSSKFPLTNVSYSVYLVI